MNTPSVLLVGLHASAVDFAKWPDLSPAKLEAAFETVLAELTAAGMRGRWCLIEDVETAETTLRDGLRDATPDVVVIGAGVRTDPDHLLLFEQLVNVIHEAAPQAKLAFNANPLDTINAVRRWA